jgi:hypothetical protein
MPEHHCKAESRRLQGFLEQSASEAGEVSGFVQRSSKLTSAVFAQTLVLSCLDEPEASLNQMTQWSRELGVELTAQALDQRLTERAVDFLVQLVARAVATFRRPTSLPVAALAQFSRIILLDSTQVALPDSLQTRFAGSGGNAAVSSVKFHLSFDYLAGQVHALAAVDGRSPDQKCGLHRQDLAVNSLYLFDLGYFEQRAVADITAAGAYVVCRLHSQVGVYATPTACHALDMAELVGDLAGNQYEFKGYVGGKTRLPMRILLHRLPASVVEERRRKAQSNARRRGKTYSQAYLSLLAWAILITNVPPERLSFEQVLAVYPIRWQIELVFKLWKSHARLASVGQWRWQRVLCHLYARLLALVLFHWLVAPWRFGAYGELSLTKAFQVLQRHTCRLAQALSTGGRGLAAVLAKIAGDFLRFARKDKRQKSPSSFQAFIQAVP